VIYQRMKSEQTVSDYDIISKKNRVALLEAQISIIKGAVFREKREIKAL